MIESADFLNSQAIELANQGLYTEAIACFFRAISISQENYLLWYNLGVTLRDSGKLEEAASALYQAYKLNCTDAEVYESLSHVYFLLGDYESARIVNLEGLDYFPENARLWNNLGVIYFNTSDFTSAADAFESAVSIYPYYYDALYNLRDTYIELQNTAGASECNLRLKNLSNQNGDFYA
jgi:tetratricopeptide (TPR) repeat protein